MSNSNPMQDAIIEVLSRRITDEGVDLAEAAQAVIDGLRLRQEWTWRLENGESGLTMQSRAVVEKEIEGLSPAPGILHRLVTDWTPDRLDE